VENTKLIGRRGRCDGDEGGMRGEIQTAGSCGGRTESELADSNCIGLQGRTGKLQKPQGGESVSDASISGQGCSVVGNAKRICFPTAREHRALDEASGISADAEGRESSQTYTESGAARKREGSRADVSECGEAQPSLGRDADGPACGLGYAELCVSCDNRTDELRLLGNGVVPATAERAFRVLIDELTK